MTQPVRVGLNLCPSAEEKSRCVPGTTIFDLSAALHKQVTRHAPVSLMSSSYAGLHARFMVLTLFLVSCLMCYSQGTFSFTNKDLFRGVDAPVFAEDCTTPLAGADGWVAQLYASTDSAALYPASAPVPFDGVGYYFGGSVTLPGVEPNALVRLQVVVWNTQGGNLSSYESAGRSGGSIGASPEFTVLSGSIRPAPLIGLHSFCIRPPISISRISDVKVYVDTSTPPLAFQIAADRHGDGDPVFTPEELILEGWCNDPSLVSSEGIQFGGTGAERSVIITPARGVHGVGQITIKVTDPEGFWAHVVFAIVITRMIDPDKSVFVHAALGDDNSTGGMQDPFRTIERALQEAVVPGQHGLTVCVHAGVYTPESTLAIPDGVKIYGGFDARAEWSHPTRERTIVLGPTMSVSVFISRRVT